MLFGENNSQVRCQATTVLDFSSNREISGRRLTSEDIPIPTTAFSPKFKIQTRKRQHYTLLYSTALSYYVLLCLN